MSIEKRLSDLEQRAAALPAPPTRSYDLSLLSLADLRRLRDLRSKTHSANAHDLSKLTDAEHAELEDLLHKAKRPTAEEQLARVGADFEDRMRQRDALQGDDLAAFDQQTNSDIAAACDALPPGSKAKTEN